MAKRLHIEPNDAQVTALQRMNPDPFIQAAAFRLYLEAPGLLDSAAYVVLAHAEGLTPTQMLDTLQRHPRVTMED